MYRELDSLLLFIYLERKDWEKKQNVLSWMSYQSWGSMEQCSLPVQCQEHSQFIWPVMLPNPSIIQCCWLCSWRCGVSSAALQAYPPFLLKKALEWLDMESDEALLYLCVLLQAASLIIVSSYGAQAEKKCCQILLLFSVITGNRIMLKKEGLVLPCAYSETQMIPCITRLFFCGLVEAHGLKPFWLQFGWKCQASGTDKHLSPQCSLALLHKQYQ